MKLFTPPPALLLLVRAAFALDGHVLSHDPSTIVRCAVINGGGAADFCARFLDANDRPLQAFGITLPRKQP